LLQQLKQTRRKAKTKKAKTMAQGKQQQQQSICVMWCKSILFA